MLDDDITLNHLSDHDVVLLVAGSRNGCAESQEAYQPALQDLAHGDPVAWQRSWGLTPAAARRLHAALELHRRLLRARRPTTALTQPAQVAQVMLPLVGLDHERLWCLCLDPRSRLIGEPVQISQGDVDGCDAGPRSFFRNALRRAASTAIAVHNHPSGDVSPSHADAAVTRRLVAAGRAVDVQLVDHVIVNATGGFVSLRLSQPELFR